jgi:hypothetical protein
MGLCEAPSMVLRSFLWSSGPCSAIPNVAYLMSSFDSTIAPYAVLPPHQAFKLLELSLHLNIKDETVRSLFVHVYSAIRSRGSSAGREYCMLIIMRIKLPLTQAASSAPQYMILFTRIFGILQKMSILNTTYGLRRSIPCHTYLQSLQRLSGTEKKCHNLGR